MRSSELSFTENISSPASSRYSSCSVLDDSNDVDSGDERLRQLKQNARRYETDDDLGMFSSIDACEQNNTLGSHDGPLSPISSFGLPDHVSQREKELMKLNERINKQTQKLEQETEEIIKEQDEKLRKAPTLTGMTTNVSTRSRPVTSRESAASGRKRRPQSRSRSRAHSRASSVVNLSNMEDDEVDVAVKELAPDAAMKFYKARVKAMEQDMKEIMDELRDKDKRMRELESENRKLTEENNRLKRVLSTAQTRSEKTKRQLDIEQSKRKDLEQENKELRRQLEEARRREKSSGGSGSDFGGAQGRGQKGRPSQQDLRYNRAMDEIEKLKTQINEARKERREYTEDARRKIDKLQAENKMLERQRHDLILGFKKQSRMIGILKRQMLHIETARMLSFTEEQFAKAIGFGQNNMMS